MGVKVPRLEGCVRTDIAIAIREAQLKAEEQRDVALEMLKNAVTDIEKELGSEFEQAREEMRESGNSSWNTTAVIAIRMLREQILEAKHDARLEEARASRDYFQQMLVAYHNQS